MRTAKTHIRRHGEKGLVLVYDDTVPLRNQIVEFKKVRGRQVDDKVSEVQFQSSDGPLMVVRFLTPDQFKAREDAHKKAVAEAKSKAEAEAKKIEKVKADKLAKHKAVAKANTAADEAARKAAAEESK